MKEKVALPVALMVVFALTRIPGMLPENFSAAYALVFCAGVYLPGKMGWWLPLGTLVLTDLLLNLHYQINLGIDSFRPGLLLYLGANYAAYLAIIFLGRRFSAQTSWVSLLSGGILGAVLFYLITNSLSWLFNPFQNPEYTRNLAGWLQALSRGTAGWPHTWEFFRNTLASGGLFTGLFAGAMKLAAALEPKEQPAEEDDCPEPAAGEAAAETPEQART